MKVIKLLLFLSVTVLLHSAEAYKEGGLESPRQANRDFYLKNKLGDKKYKLPLSAALNSNLIKESLEKDPHETELAVLIPDNILEPLVKGLIILDKNQGKRDTNKIDLIIKNSLNNIPNEDLVALVHNSGKLLSPILERAVYRKYAMALKKNRKQLIKTAIANFDKHLRHEIAKEYHLLYGKDIQLRGPKEPHKEVGFSIDELLREGKLKNRINEFLKEKMGEEMDEHGMYKKVPAISLDLSNLKLNSLKGLEKIPKINEAKTILLNNNKLSDLNGLNIAKSMQYLNLEKNKIKTLGNNLNDLNKLRTLNLQNNAIKTIENSLDNLPDLYEVELKENPIKEAETKRLQDKYRNISFQFEQHLIDYPDYDYEEAALEQNGGNEQPIEGELLIENPAEEAINAPQH